MPAIIEICVDSIESALAAVKGGSNRIELCSALSEGGLTPSPGLLKTLKDIEKINIPIYCMLRPRCGNDFQYSTSEIETILYDLDVLKSLGSDGFVFGALDNKRNINVEHCKKIINASGNIPVTFHRAFDMTDNKNMIENCNLIESMGFKRLLTSGFKQTAELGLENLKKLTEEFQNRELIIMPGSGINLKNIDTILKETNCKEFHTSAKIKKNIINAQITMGDKENDKIDEIFVTDSNIVEELVALNHFFYLSNK